jgi:hypothetical protein
MDVAIEMPRQKKVRPHVFIAAVLIGIAVFVVLPRFFLRSELETIGPTDKLRFLRAVEKSEYRRVGQVSTRFEEQTLIVVWDLRWNTLPENKQREIVRIMGHAWSVVGGADTQFRIEGEDGAVASYKDGQIQLTPP